MQEIGQDGIDQAIDRESERAGRFNERFFFWQID